MSHSPLERIRELLAVAEDARRPTSYARNFEKGAADGSIARGMLAGYEQDLLKLDEGAWRALKASAIKRLIRGKKKGWEPLYDILNEAKAYAYLSALGCTGIEIVPTSYDYKTPDLKADVNGVPVLCEVKTINLSEDAISGGDDPSSCGHRLSDEFLEGKLTWTLRAAKAQLDAFASPAARKIAFIVFNSDESLNAAAGDHALQLKTFLRTFPLGDIEVEIRQVSWFHSGAV